MPESDEISAEIIERGILRVTGECQAIPGPTCPAERYRTTASPAIARCREAWQKAYDDYIQKNARKDGSLAEMRAAKAAATAYLAAMPELAGFMGIRDFIACVASGVLFEVIPPDRSRQLLYAAQIALALLPRIPTD